MHITATQVLTALASHVGQDQGIHVRELVTGITGQPASCGVLERRIRTLITELRMRGEPICGHPTEGYYIAASGAELERTCALLHSRAMSSLAILSRMRKVSMAQLLRQLSLPTDPAT